MQAKGTTIWIAWEKHRRSIELCNHFNIKSFFLHSTSPRIVRYPILLLRSWLIIKRELPKILFVQNPSIALAFFSVFLRNILKYRIVVDAHNDGILPSLSILKKINFIHRYIQKHSDLVIVSNVSLKQIVEHNGGKAFVLPDKIPEFKNKNPCQLNGQFNIVYICSFSHDEPYEEVLHAAKSIPENIKIYVTGDYRKASTNLKEFTPDNITLCGFLDDNEYEALLRSSDIIMVLTHREDCLVCGAYEAVALNKPMILTGTRTLKNYFSLGAVYTENSVHHIASAIERAVLQKCDLQEEVLLLRNKLEQDWIKRSQSLMIKIDELVH